MSTNPAPRSSEYLSYTRLSLDNEDDLKYIEKAFDWTLELDGRAWVDGKSRTSWCKQLPYLKALCSPFIGKNFK
jgi:hypothetical protein